MKIGEIYRSADFKSEKHSPVIELPQAFKAGEAIEVTVSVGKEIAHPNTTEHFIAWIALYYKADGDPNAYDIGRIEFNAHGATAKGANSLLLHTAPFGKFHVKLEKSGTLFATSFCNIHGLWESSLHIDL